MSKFITSEYVAYGHPDKVCDQIADAIVDEIVSQDPNARCGIEVMMKDNKVILGGEVKTTLDYIDYNNAVMDVIDTVDYPESHHLESSQLNILNFIGQQSPEISQGVDKEDGEIGAGDQGFMVGYASNETSCLMPSGHEIARCICGRVANNRNEGFGPDAKAQVTMEYDDSGRMVGVKSILVSVMCQDNIKNVRKFVRKAIYDPATYRYEDVYERYIKGRSFNLDINPCGEWKVGGPISDCGVTGRKLVVDSYGGYCNIGGGNMSGKDMSKVDRSGAYMCRYLAKNILKAGNFKSVKVELAYKIGVEKPSMVNVNIETDLLTDNRINLEKTITEYIENNIDLTPKGIIKRFPVDNYYQLSRYGHFGWNEWSNAPWEKVDIAHVLRDYLKVRYLL